MINRDVAYDGVFAKLPADVAAQHRYFELVDIWEHMGNHRPDDREWYDAAEQSKLAAELAGILSPREMAFFNKPFSNSDSSYNSMRQARTTGRLSIILLDRHGFRAPKENGGLGS